jgi:hypothetical protein
LLCDSLVRRDKRQHETRRLDYPSRAPKPSLVRHIKHPRTN